MTRNDTRAWTLAQLAEQSGIPARTIRYYIARGLMDGPQVAGRGATYGRHHLDRLRKIQDLQSQGKMLADVARLLAGGPAQHPVPEPETWLRYVVASDVVVSVRGSVAPWRIRRIRQALTAFAANISADAEGGDK